MLGQAAFQSFQHVGGELASIGESAVVNSTHGTDGPQGLKLSGGGAVGCRTTGPDAAPGAMAGSPPAQRRRLRPLLKRRVPACHATLLQVAAPGEVCDVHAMAKPF